MYTHDMKSVVRTWGNSLAIRIPKIFAVDLGIESGEEVELVLKADGLYIKPSKKSLEEILKQIKPEQLHREIDIGAPQGKEAW
jgi:antitoxin MazE